ncbi:hypothetical protein MRBBS_1727 [Marinobacter sp. BSs20148]|nr:hypothetical protein MRBBS_1727 [Marinobacter sp. BSs20148]
MLIWLWLIPLKSTDMLLPAVLVAAPIWAQNMAYNCVTAAARKALICFYKK